MTKNITLVCKSIKYQSTVDEDIFFGWLSRISSINKIWGRLVYLYLEFAENKIPDDDLKELIVLFYRYKVPMKQLTVFLNEENKHWFQDSLGTFWHKEIFGPQKSIVFTRSKSKNIVPR